MINAFKKYDRIWFLIFCLATLVLIACTICEALNPGTPSTLARWLVTLGLVSTVAGIIQLEVSGVFEKIIDKYMDEEKYPYGPPSSITRQIIDNPDAPVRTNFRNLAFHDSRTGFWLIVVGTLVQIPAVWFA
jgi:hypothetical protein